MSAEYSVNLLCATLEISPSGYHAWLRRAPSQRAQANADLLPLISQAHRESRQTYGSPRITHWLHQHGGLRHHSDQGVQSASRNYRQRLTAAGASASMSRRGNGYDNAVMEGFWSSLKRELVYRRTFATHAEARAAIFEWIEVFYNRERLHSALGFQSPVDFENQIN